MKIGLVLVSVLTLSAGTARADGFDDALSCKAVSIMISTKQEALIGAYAYYVKEQIEFFDKDKQDNGEMTIKDQETALDTDHKTMIVTIAIKAISEPFCNTNTLIQSSLMASYNDTIEQNQAVIDSKK